MTFQEKLARYAELVELGLEAAFPMQECLQSEIFEAARYSLLGGGKRIRPGLLLEFFSLYGGDIRHAMPFAAALEMIHTYSLIHDDLPCMDDDDLRRGKPSSHKAFGEATAVLAGDALLNRAFEVMSRSTFIEADLVLRAINYISLKSGVGGMIGGQVIDIKLEKQEQVSPEVHAAMVNLKTGALFEAACAGGCILAGQGEDIVAKAESFGRVFGVMFQLSDDVLDVLSTEAELGKTVGSDAKQGKRTFVTVYGLEECAKMLEKMAGEARELLKAFPPSELLGDLTAWMVTRKN